MRKTFNFILLWLVLFFTFGVFACKSVQKGGKEEPGEAAVTVSQTNTAETGTGKAAGTAAGKAKAGSTETGKGKAAGTATGKAKAGSTETGKGEGKPETFAELKEKVITEVGKKISPTVRKAILPSVVGFLILVSLLSSKKEKDDIKRKRRQKTPALDPLY